MGEAIPTVVETAIEHTHGRAGRDGDDSAPIDAVAFARGPGLRPCLRIVATAARAVAQRFVVSRSALTTVALFEGDATARASIRRCASTPPARTPTF